MRCFGVRSCDGGGQSYHSHAMQQVVSPAPGMRSRDGKMQLDSASMWLLGQAGLGTMHLVTVTGGFKGEDIGEAVPACVVSEGSIEIKREREKRQMR